MLFLHVKIINGILRIRLYSCQAWTLTSYNLITPMLDMYQCLVRWLREVPGKNLELFRMNFQMKISYSDIERKIFTILSLNNSAVS